MLTCCGRSFPRGTVPKAPCTDMVTTWALKGLLYHDFGAYVYTTVVLGAFGLGLFLAKCFHMLKLSGSFVVPEALTKLARASCTPHIQAHVALVSTIVMFLTRDLHIPHNAVNRISPQEASARDVRKLGGCVAVSFSVTANVQEKNTPKAPCTFMVETYAPQSYHMVSHLRPIDIQLLYMESLGTTARTCKGA